MATKKAKEEETVGSELDRAVAMVKKKWGEGAVFAPGDEIKIDQPILSTGISQINEIVGNGGFARGTILVIYGQPSSGKSTMCLQIIAEAQKQGLKTLFIDQEQALNAKYAESLGVNLAELYIAQPRSMEQALGILETLVSTGEIGVVVVDSIASLVPEAELEKGIDEETMGIQPKKMSSWLRRFNPVIADTNTLLIFTNQLRENIGAYRGGSVQPGGKAIRFYASYMMEVKVIKRIEDSSGQQVGNKLLITMTKNKLSPPFRYTELDLVFGEGVDKYFSLISTASNLGLVIQGGAWFSFSDYMASIDERFSNSFQGKAKVRTFLMENEDLYAVLKEAVEEFQNASE